MLQILEADLLMALGDHDNVFYLDRETGDVIFIPTDLFGPGDEEYVDEEALAENPRYVQVEPTASREAFQWMEEFASQVADPELRRRLERALHRPRPFRGFKDELLAYPVERQQWFDFETVRQREAAREWLAMNDIAAELVSQRAQP